MEKKYSQRRCGQICHVQKRDAAVYARCCVLQSFQIVTRYSLLFRLAVSLRNCTAAYGFSLSRPGESKRRQLRHPVQLSMKRKLLNVPLVRFLLKRCRAKQQKPFSGG